jgi:predicted ATPase
MARLDRLGPAKEVAQIGAAIGREFSHALLAAVVCKSDAELGLALDRLIQSGLLFRQGAPPHATYLFKHALVQDAAYGTLLREPRRALHARIAETLESQFTDIAESQPELLARHCAEAGLIEKAAGFWGNAGQRSLERSALVEAIEQFTRALSKIATLPATPALRRDKIKFQIALITPLVHVKGYAAPETKAAIEQAHLLIKQAEALGEHPDDPILSYTVLYAFWAVNFVAFNGDVMRELATQFLALAEKQGSNAMSLIGHRLMGTSLFYTGNIIEGRNHLDRAIELYDAHQHRPLATRFGQDIGVPALCFRSLALWVLGYPDAALLDSELARSNAHAIGQAATLMYSLSLAPFIQIVRGNYIEANETANELVALAGETGTSFWKARGMLEQGCALAVIGKAVDAVRLITLGLDEWRLTGTTLQIPWYLVNLARAFADPAICQLDEALRSINDAMTTSEASGEKWCEPEVYRVAGEVTLRLPQPDAAKAEVYFQRALVVARKEQAKSWELRAAISMARLLRDQGKREEARELLAPVYGWFTEGFDTLDLKDGKALLDELSQ